MIIINAEYRKNTGTGNSRKLRINNKCPGIVYGKKQPNIPISINQYKLLNIEKTNKLLHINSITLIINEIEYTVKIANIQYHPFKKRIIHVDFIYLI